MNFKDFFVLTNSYFHSVFSGTPWVPTYSVSNPRIRVTLAGCRHTVLPCLSGSTGFPAGPSWRARPSHMCPCILSMRSWRRCLHWKDWAWTHGLLMHERCPCLRQPGSENIDDNPLDYTERQAFASQKTKALSPFLLYFILFRISKQASSFTLKTKTQTLQLFLLMLGIKLVILEEALYIRLYLSYYLS